MVETYVDMRGQIQKERVAFEKIWALREKQAQKLIDVLLMLFESCKAK